MVTDLGFSKEKGPGQSWVDLGREYDMKAGRSRVKTEPVVTAMATLLGQIFFRTPDDEPIREFRPLISDGRSQRLPPLRGGSQVQEMASGSEFGRRELLHGGAAAARPLPHGGRQHSGGLHLRQQQLLSFLPALPGSSVRCGIGRWSRPRRMGRRRAQTPGRAGLDPHAWEGLS